MQHRCAESTEPVGDEFLNDDPMIEYLLAFGDEKDNEDDGDGKWTIVQKLRKKIMGMVKIRRGLTVDSGAADHVMPLGWLIMFLVVKSLGQMRGLHYVAASGTRIPNLGQQIVKFMTMDGTWTELIFQIAAINKPLISVSKLNENGYRVVFDDDSSYILHKKSKRVIKMRKERSVFVIDAYVNKKPDTGFTGQR